MNNINWRAVDLNLLITFDFLMELRSVGKAENKLSVGQSTVSQAYRA
jgi:LysR family transcriptional activator of mexEF-oprN operon